MHQPESGFENPQRVPASLDIRDNLIDIQRVSSKVKDLIVVLLAKLLIG
jgi:hypothetical protein